MAVSKRLRYEVLRRDGHTCRYCGAQAPGVKLAVDHVVPVALGGTDEPTNLVTACEPCNSGKTSTPADAPIVASVADDAARWAMAMQKAAEDAHADLEARRAYREKFRNAWDGWGVGGGAGRKAIPLEPGWQISLDNMREAGLPDWELEEAVAAAMGAQKVPHRNKFRYFCGVCWTKVRKIQDNARSLVAVESTDEDVRQSLRELLDGFLLEDMTPVEIGLLHRWATLRLAAGTPFTEGQGFNAAWQVSCLVRSGVAPEEVGRAIEGAAALPWPVRLVEALGTGIEAWDAWQGFFFASARITNATCTFPWSTEEQQMVKLDVLRSALTYIATAVDHMASESTELIDAKAVQELSRSVSGASDLIDQCLPEDFPLAWREDNYVENPLAMWGGWWNRRQHPEWY